jgi:hypothetical protein
LRRRGGLGIALARLPGLRNRDDRIDERDLRHLDLAAEQGGELQAEAQRFGLGHLRRVRLTALRDTDILRDEVERWKERDLQRTADPQAIPGRRLDLCEQAVAQIVGGDEERADKDDDGADDGDGRKAEERKPHVPLRCSGCRLVNGLRRNS